MSTQQEHTPGPWAISSGKIAGFRVPLIRASSGSAGGQLNIALLGGVGGLYGNAEANARLIATAPALLTMCEEAVRGFENLLRGSGGKKCYCGVEKGGCAVCKLRAVTALARGQS